MRLGQAAWQGLDRRHRARLDALVSGHLARHSLGERHPVYDFLFDYYSFTPASLLAWSPGLGIELEGPAGAGFTGRKFFREAGGAVSLDISEFPAHRLKGARWILGLLEATALRPPVFGCLGLHEWAMVYQARDVRHQQIPLRLSADALAAFVSNQSLCCTHFDAFRFFTPEARPLNRHALQRTSQLEHDQRGCVHVNMDLYKWSYKFYPWISSDLLADAFLLAVELRELDMRASPYDLADLGFESIRIETPTGREEYRCLQRELSARAQPIRERLIAAYRDLIERAAECRQSLVAV